MQIPNLTHPKPTPTTLLPLIKKSHKYNENKYQSYLDIDLNIDEGGYKKSRKTDTNNAKHANSFTVQVDRKWRNREDGEKEGKERKGERRVERGSDGGRKVMKKLYENSTNLMPKHPKLYKTPPNQPKLQKKLKPDSQKLHPDINLTTKKIHTIQKPPHRYKTAMLIYKHCLLLYGGLGCEKNLTWARLGFEDMSWQMYHDTQDIKPINTYFPLSPIYGHTLSKHKDLAIVYGGSSSTDQINETTIINTKTMQIYQGARCPYRRKQHAAVVVGDMVVVHGGIQAREVRGDVFVYFVGGDKWVCLVGVGLPALASHKMVKGKNNKEIYMFGGLNTKYKSTNKLYKIKILTSQPPQLKSQQIDTMSTPNPRHSFCLQKISNSHILLYGGRQDNQTDYPEQGLEKGVFNDVHLYNIDKRSWRKVDMGGIGGIGAEFQYCFGMASTSVNGGVFVFGGANCCRYADAGIRVLWNGDQRGDPWECIQGTEVEICSSKKVSHQKIL